MKCIVLAGGGGRSLWPLSRKNYPIQFAEVCEGRSVFQESIARHLPYCDEFYIFANKEHEYIVKGQLEVFQELNYKLFFECEPLNTGLPILLGLLYSNSDENVMVLGCSAIYSGNGFRDSFMEGVKLLDSNSCVILGMPITEINTKLGYFKHSKNTVDLFVEKPNKKLLENLLQNGEWLCNTGKYLINCRLFLDCIKSEFPQMYADARNALESCDENDNNITVPAGVLSDELNTSFEKGILSNITGVSSIELKNTEWHLLSNWKSIGKIIKDSALTDVVKKDCNNTTIINNTDNKLIVANGVDDLVIVNTDDAIYIEGENATSSIKAFLSEYKNKYKKYIEYNNFRYRRWGKYTVINNGEGYTIKEVVVYPHKEMSLHKHKYRTEHWAIVDGVAEITIDDAVKEYPNDTSVFVPSGAYHKIANRTNKNLLIVETEIGNYIDEKDMVSQGYKSDCGTQNEIVKLKPIFKDYLWGGTRLRDEWNKACDWEVIAESWELSAHSAGNSIIDSGEDKGESFGKYIEKNGDSVVGWKCKAFYEFPILIKLIDSKKPLSVQVHPNDDFAMAVENEYGKNEMWYIVDCDEDAFIYCGFNKNVSIEEFKKRIEDNTITEVLNKIPVKKGDSYFIPAGTVHAIGKGILTCEIQQNSNSTYRIYDYDRKDKDGNKRELHIDKAIQVINFERYTPYSDEIIVSKDEYGNRIQRLCACKYFEVNVIEIDKRAEIVVDGSSFYAIVIIDGSVTISDERTEKIANKGDTLFVPAGAGVVKLEGKSRVVITHI